MAMFSDGLGQLVANLGARRGARQESNADARARQMLLSSIQDPLYAGPTPDQVQAANVAAESLAPATGGGQFGFTPAPGSTVAPMLTGLQPIITDPIDASQSSSKSERGVSGASRNKVETLLFPMLTKAENRDLSRKTAELDQLVRARPALVSRMYAGEAGAKPIDDRIRALQTEIEKGQSANERLLTSQMMTGQRLISSYSSGESQAARLAAQRDMAAARESTKRAIAAGRLAFDDKKLAVNSSLKGLDQMISLYGIKSNYLSSPAALQRAVMTGELDRELLQHGFDENTIGKTVGGIRRGVLLIQSQNPDDITRGASILMDAQMDMERLLGTGPDPEPNKWAAKYNEFAPEGLQVDAISPEQADEIKKANATLRETENPQLGTLKPGEAPPKLVFPGGPTSVRVTESTSSTRPSKVAPKPAAQKKGWYKDPDGVMRKH
jgi:hypothetical protein